MAYYQWLKSFYFELKGWGPATGKPLPQTFRTLSLEQLIADDRDPKKVR